jgi:hypothetical protein
MRQMVVVLSFTLLLLSVGESQHDYRKAQSAPDRVTLYTADGAWKVEISVWISNLAVYKSIGTDITVYTRRSVGGLFGLFPHVDWVETPVDSIAIYNTYSGLPHSISKRGGWSNTGHAQLFEWAVGVNISVDDEGNPGGGGGATLDLHRVDGSVEIRIGSEHLNGAVTPGY